VIYKQIADDLSRCAFADIMNFREAGKVLGKALLD